MPLQSAHVFASHIGHTGKTTLSFQMSCYYAKRHPEISVLVMDLSEEGDLTKRFLGGVDSATGKLEELAGGVFRLLSDADRKTSFVTRWLWSSSFDVTKHAVKPVDHNPAIPPNLFLISSGAWPRGEPPLADDSRQRTCSNIRESLQSSSSTWKLFCDTDGDRRPSPFTLLGYGLCQQAIVPLHLNKSDLDRTETMLGLMYDYRERGEISTQVLFVVWNMVKSLKDEPCVHKGTTFPFTPTKVNLDILDACNKRLVDLSKSMPGLFVHWEADDAAFIESSTCVLRQLADNVLKPSEELGQPFVQMVDQLAASGKKTLKFHSGGVDYETKDVVLNSVDDAIRNIQDKFEAMSLTRVAQAPAPSAGVAAVSEAEGQAEAPAPMALAEPEAAAPA